MDGQERTNAARAEMNAAINRIGTKYDLPPYIMELILNSTLSDVRAQINMISTIERSKEKKEVKNTDNGKAETSDTEV